MAEKNKKPYTHIGVKFETQRKVAILSKVLDGTNMYSLVEFWADKEWADAKAAGLVTDAMIGKKTRGEGKKAAAG